ncbi:HD domain-containing protein [Clostridium saccharobutylicum]|uniref:Metal dependent phosphohydrolase n=1 Tax=Clostridium saccharobutylicum DSM 13864 TaxID=1345695 RepID=U5MNP5_CLOSA|nr:HD domain-containing protein [Clostridium saccharobutylicum]AGX41311.1 metal dependent phosphohydrolase [Clostridium saccharobutylicum DSM 13864]AQR88597.1 ribonuclease Y [Clostridium saccharobutylicum]AQR98495.1 ribonuclease Y [Clostridium saccharobutylicum]AQS08207.1 ribonuclease Y [Clostridium saccharobutylicum]AQS12485.1 ribonuclease Y [Clostridium saccharobutylicum]
MERFNYILNDEKYIDYLKRNKKFEENRRFCRHNLEHFLDVARIAQEINLEENLGFKKEIIYTTAILHDIGKSFQYENGTPHEIASWEIAKEILENYNFNEEEIELIEQGVLGHRNKLSDGFSLLIYRADKLSRLCISCNAIDECKWSNEKKNFKIYY